ncbi:MAG TPA: diaminopimelate epimerase, partial [Legionellaceae bacterium]|nr:diaminopimelate epimerase [Legionellaceae bacterium]
FSKMHGLGNHFMVIDTTKQDVLLTPEKIKNWANYQTGIGFDQLMVITHAPNSTIDFGYRIFNRDGSEAEQCGNGVRCVARFIHEKKLSSKKKLRLASPFVMVDCELQNDHNVTVNMGVPNFSPISLPFLIQAQNKVYDLSMQDEVLSFGAVSLPNPHVILKYTDIHTIDLSKVGLFFNDHADFPKGVNVGAMQLINSKHIRLRVFERGAGETAACGTNACAAVAIGLLWGILEKEVRVSLQGGDLFIKSTDNNEFFMTGPAVIIFDGKITNNE